MDVFCRGQPLQDVLIVQVVAEQQDLIVHAKEATLWELGRGEDTKSNVLCVVSDYRSKAILMSRHALHCGGSTCDRDTK